jgi:hypothetical protein
VRRKPVLSSLGAFENHVRLGPGGLFGVRKDRTERKAEFRPASVARGGGANTSREVAHLLIGLAPEREDVGVLSRHFDRRVAGAGDVDVDVALAIGLDLRERVLDLIMAALVGEGLAARPFLSDNIEEFVGARVALVLVNDEIAVAHQFLRFGAGDDIDGDTALRELVERREPTRKHGRRSEAGAVRDEDAEPLGHARGVLADLKTVGRVGMEGEQRAVEAGIFVRLCDRLDVVAIDDGSAARNDLRGIVIANEPDEFD